MQTSISKYFRPKQDQPRSPDLVVIDPPPAILTTGHNLPYVEPSVDRQTKFHNKLLDVFDRPVDKPDTLAAPSSYTPLEKQVINIREKYKDCLLMVECGYKIRFFGDDAVAAAKVLSIQAHHDHSFMVASVPTYRAFIHCKRLVSAGYKVAIVRQKETAALKKAKRNESSSSTFERAVCGVFTAGYWNQP